MSISDADFTPPYEIFINPNFSLPMEFLEFSDILKCQKET